MLRVIVARKKKQPDDAPDRPAPVPTVGTSMKGLMKGISLASLDEAAKASHHAPKASHHAPKASHHAPKASHHTPKASQASAPSAPTPAGPSGATVVARPSDGLKGNDRIAFYDAIAGVRSLDAGRPRPRRAVPVKTSAAAIPPREPQDGQARKKLGELVGGAYEFDVAIEDDGFVEGLRRDAPIEALGALRREQPRVDQTLDLHGLREAVVEDRLARWIRESHKKGGRRLLVIHGKGLHSTDGIAVLRDAVLRVLEASIATPLVLAFASAPPAMGGTGATLVELTRERS